MRQRLTGNSLIDYWRLSVAASSITQVAQGPLTVIPVGVRVCHTAHLPSPCKDALRSVIFSWRAGKTRGRRLT